MVTLALQVYTPLFSLVMSLNISWPVSEFIMGLPLAGTGSPSESNQVMVGVAKRLSTVVAVHVIVMASLQPSPSVVRDVTAVDSTGAGTPSLNYANAVLYNANS